MIFFPVLAAKIPYKDGTNKTSSNVNKEDDLTWFPLVIYSLKQIQHSGWIMESAEVSNILELSSLQWENPSPGEHPQFLPPFSFRYLIISSRTKASACHLLASAPLQVWLHGAQQVAWFTALLWQCHLYTMYTIQYKLLICSKPTVLM